MKLPENKDPLGWDADGRPQPLIVAPSLLERTRKMFPRLWVEANPPIPA